VFSLDGKFIRQLARYDAPFARNLAFSPDPDQKYIHAGHDKGIALIDRKSMDYIGMIKAPGLDVPGHQIASAGQAEVCCHVMNADVWPHLRRHTAKRTSVDTKMLLKEERSPTQSTT
jgi:hypothetical protein